MPYDNVPELPDFDIEFDEIDMQDMIADELKTLKMDIFADMGLEATLDPDEDDDEEIEDLEPYEDDDYFNPDEDNEDDWN
tara:strand:+ start:246 stop:485 length:240 start_codon:yes stop_codon:yes gene_type:complete